MKKLLLIVLVILIGAGIYIYFDPELKQQTRQQIDKLQHPGETRTLYRWQDADGQWQITDFPPPQGTAFETLRYNAETNVIPSENLTGQKEK
jgi:hypothetical protein